MRTRPIVPCAVLLLAALAACDTQPRPIPPEQHVPADDPEAGRARLREYGCQTCHTIPGVAGPTAPVGPPLSGWSERRFIAGELPNEPDSPIAFIVDPPRVRPGTAMPNVGVTERDPRDMAAYLHRLR